MQPVISAEIEVAVAVSADAEIKMLLQDRPEVEMIVTIETDHTEGF